MDNDNSPSQAPILSSVMWTGETPDQSILLAVLAYMKVILDEVKENEFVFEVNLPVRLAGEFKGAFQSRLMLTRLYPHLNSVTKSLLKKYFEPYGLSGTYPAGERHSVLSTMPLNISDEIANYIYDYQDYNETIENVEKLLCRPQSMTYGDVKEDNTRPRDIITNGLKYQWIQNAAPSQVASVLDEANHRRCKVTSNYLYKDTIANEPSIYWPAAIGIYAAPN